MALHRAAASLVAATSLCFAANLSHASSAGTLGFATTTHAEVQNTAARSLPVVRTGGSSGVAGAVCTAVSGTAILGTDFTLTSTALQWADGDAAPKNCVVTILDNNPFSGTKSFTLQLTSVTGASVGAGAETVTIQGNKGGGSVSLSSATYSFAQNAGAATISVSRSGGASGGAVVFYSTANGTAVAGADYTKTSGMLSWANGDASAKTISIPVSGAVPFSGAKTFAVALASAEGVVLGTQTSAIVTITGGSGGSGGSGTGSATLSWTPPAANLDGTPLTPLAGYTIHYGTSQSAMNQAVNVTGQATTSYELSGLTQATWYFAVSANAEDGTSGPESLIGSKTIN